MAQKPPNPHTLFHLVPSNDAAREALEHPDNRRFVSPCAGAGNAPGLEVGFHVPSVPGRVIARLGRGRQADLVLLGRSVASIHAAIELHPDTNCILLSARTKQTASITIKEENRIETVQGDCVLCYNATYDITLATCAFRLVWTQPKQARDLAVRDYEKALQHLRHASHRARSVPFREADESMRFELGSGTFGTVYRAVDLLSGNPFAVEVIDLVKFKDVEKARADVHSEVKALERLKHDNIIELLGCVKFDTLMPEIIMPLRAGSLQNLADDVSRPCTFDDLCTQVLQQMLGALDYLDCNGMCHRDVKPDNILYWDNTGHGVYTFQLADFGLAKHHLQATTLCGTPLYEVPELYPDLYGDYPQSPKMDIWSLFATIIHVHPEFAFPPRSHITSAIISAVEAAADIAKRLSPMARRNRHHRASAAQMLMLLFDGQGLTTAKHLVPAITNQPAPARPHPLLPAQHRVPSVAVPPLVQYPRNKQPRLAKGLGLQLRQQRLPRRKIGVPAPRGVVPDGRIVKPASAGVGAAAARPRPPC